VTLRGIIAALACLIAVNLQSTHAQDFDPLFSGTDLKGWIVEHSYAQLRDGVLQVGTGNGWVRTRRPFSNFTLKMDIRLLGEHATGGIFVRAWPTFDDASTPTNGYRITFPPTQPASPGASASADSGGWSHVEVECDGRTLVVMVDGKRLATSDTIGNPQGYIALWASAGKAEFKGLEVKEHPVPKWEVPDSVKPGEGVVLPRITKAVKPRYTREAMAAKIEGHVLLTSMVLPDGTVGEVVVRRSLDPKFGLDREAASAASQWRFVPATRGGKPVSVIVTMELTFTLKTGPQGATLIPTIP